MYCNQSKARNINKSASKSIDLSKSDDNLKWNYMMNVIAVIIYIELLPT